MTAIVRTQKSIGEIIKMNQETFKLLDLLQSIFYIYKHNTDAHIHNFILEIAESYPELKQMIEGIEK